MGGVKRWSKGPRRSVVRAVLRSLLSSGRGSWEEKKKGEKATTSFCGKGIFFPRSPPHPPDDPGRLSERAGPLALEQARELGGFLG